MRLPEIIKVELGRFAAGTPHDCGWDFATWNDAEWLGQDLAADLLKLSARLRNDLTNYGFAIVATADGEGLYASPAYPVTRLLSLLGTPIRVFQREPAHWRRVDVDLSRPPRRSRGSGRQALHLDFVNAENPPDMVCLYCQIEDPLGGGASLVANYVGVEDELIAEHREILQRSIFRDGKFEALENIGSDANPFAILSGSKKWRFRYTTNLLNADVPCEVRIALHALNHHLDQRTVSYRLRKGEMLIIDQHRALHGRAPVGSPQDLLPVAERRLVLHSFVRRQSVKGA